jgi:hypothetical protein
VIARTSVDGARRLVAYVSLSGNLTAERLRAHVERGATRGAPLAIVAVSNLPLTPDGSLDDAALASIPVLDDGVVARWREAVGGDAAVALGNSVQRARRLHLSALVPGRPTTEATKDAPASSSIGGAADTVSTTSSISRGADLELEPGAPATLAEALARAAADAPEKGFTFVRASGAESRVAHPALLGRAERVVGGLRRLGLRPGDKSVFQLD